MPKRSNGFDKDSNRASEAGKKSKRKGIDEKLREIASELDGDNKLTIDQAINLKLISLAKEGDLQAIKEYLDRCYGKSKQYTETRDKTLEDNPMYSQLKAITDKFKDK